uniref:Protein kinase domain-containing protein n=1 Tax=Meloidogyne floridensis TaxID=298350 RepID=A0A915NWI2_9BILA
MAIYVYRDLHAGCCQSRPSVQGGSAIPSPSHNIIHQSHPSPPPSHPQENLTAVASSSSSQHVFDKNRCKCQRQLKNDMFVEEEYDGIKLKYKREDVIGSGGYSTILHAYWKSEDIGKDECVALKDIQMYNDEKTKIALNEINVLSEVMKLPSDQRDHIISMYGSEEKTLSGNEHMYIILELGGIDLEVYYNEMHKNEDLLLNILKCAARGLQQFHAIGIHLDIKAKNFIIPLDQDLNSPLESCKLIDFSFSVITEQEPVEIELYGTLHHTPPEFGTKMVCMENEADNRPSIKALNDFLNKKCHRFISEQNEYGELCEN